jgi:hypothetical protein
MATKPMQACSIENPKATFETALASMQGNSEGRARTAIAVRTRPIFPVLDEQATEKRALTDAARALARLWNVSPHLVR